MPVSPLLASKCRALLVQLGLCALIYIPFLVLFWVSWFPPPLFYTDGGLQGARIMLLVGMVLGPALTFLVYNPAKSRREKIVDFTCIGLVQAVALAYGLMAVEHNRLKAVVFNGDAFYAVPAQFFDRQGVDEAAWRAFETPRGGPQAWVYQRDPTPEEMPRVEQMINEGQVPYEAFFQLYEPLVAGIEVMTKQTFKVDPLAERFPELKERHQAFLLEKGLKAEDVKLFPLYGGFTNVLVVISNDGRYLGYIDWNPRLARKP